MAYCCVVELLVDLPQHRSGDGEPMRARFYLMWSDHPPDQILKNKHPVEFTSYAICESTTYMLSARKVKQLIDRGELDVGLSYTWKKISSDMPE